MTFILHALRANTAGRAARHRAIRKIGEQLMCRYRNLDTWLELMEYNDAKELRRQAGRRNLGAALWHIYRTHGAADIAVCLSQYRVRKHVGALRVWADGACTGERVRVERLIHNIRCLVVYIRLIAKPEEVARGDKRKREDLRRRALWRVCAVLVRIYKQDKQQQILDERATQREGKVCAHTRNVDRLTPMGGVTYDETRRRGERIKQDEMYKTHRWPRRDKHGPTLVRMLHHAWGIT